jgi:hypothetical protein
MQIRKMIPVFAIAMGLVLALATSGFRQGPKDQNKLGMHTFEYTAPSGSYSQLNVQNEANWVYTSSTSRCNDQDVKACRIFVTDDDVTTSGSGFVLNPGFEITASAGSNSYVISTDAGSGSNFVSNKSGL